MVKMVSLSDEAYRGLKAVKGMKSFSEVVVELLKEKGKKKKSIKEFIGIWKDDAVYWKEFEKKVYEDRKRAKMREVNL